MARRADGTPPGCFAPAATPAAWRELVFGIPGYDPTRGADGCWFDPAAARLALDFFPEMLVHIEGAKAGEPFALEVWQQAVVANLFGWKKRHPSGRVVRRYRELFEYVPRKAGKTPKCAGIGEYVFFCDKEAGQQGYVAAKDREQASLLFRQMNGHVSANPALASRCRVYGGNAPAGQSRSFVKPDGSFLKVISGEGSGKHGGNPHLVIVDELHEQESPELIHALETSMVSENRLESLFISLTTADYDRPSICNTKYEYAKRVRDNPESDPAFLPVIYEAAPTDDPYSPATWKKANPNLGVSVSVEAMEREAAKAKTDPAYAVEFKRLFLNLRTRPVVTNAIDMGLWDGCGEPFDPDLLLGKDCWAAMDYGWRDDYAALALVFPVGDLVYVRPYFWVPKEGKRDLRAVPAAGFVAGGHLAVTAGNSTDVDAIYEVLRDARRKYSLRKIAYDPNNARKQGQDLMAEGFEVVEFYQSKRNYSEPWKWLMADGLKAKKLRHGGHPVLRWMAGNTAAEVDGLDGVMPKKKRSSEKIDGICAMCMALGAWLTDPDKTGRFFSPRLVVM